ncbi:MAG: Lrp/AsnC family transcriptional regulator [Zymomonas mobilis subsp. pomaceae]|nr:Lrp/AsnC family transcriptional regulator [Zymomonas mobilis]MDX5949283.1 Lrp/AsnC family transcriptional regulator [Zymomonas mobilis subsp. pomaceae]
MIDNRDRRILTILQTNAETPLTDIAEQVALSPSACSRRITRLREEGYITNTMTLLDRQKINLPTTIFLLVKTGIHTEDYLTHFHSAVNAIPEIVEVHRLTGNFDYILKLVLPNVEYYDTIYKQILRRVAFHDMSAYISMETVKLSPSLPTAYI